MWKRTTAAAGFWGLLAGTVVAVALWLWMRFDPSTVKYIAFSPAAKEMAQNLACAIWSLVANVGVTVAVTMVTRPKPDAELAGLVYGLTEIPGEGHFAWFQRPATWAAVVAAAFVLLNIIFW
jgi:SSS family solute:Na+ symporter